MAVMPVRTSGPNGGKEVISEWFVARITAVAGADTGSGACAGRAHGWIEQKVCANGTSYEDASSERADSGTTTYAAAFPIGGGAASVNDLVLMRYKGMDSGALPIYEFIKSGAGGGSGYVTSVQCTSGMTVVTYDS
jgi:hypothetical protein